MKKKFVLILCVLLILSGCSGEDNHDATIPPVIPDATPALDDIDMDTELAAVSVPASTERYFLDDDTEIFSYTYQHMELILPDENVADRVIIDFLNRVDSGRSDAENILSNAQIDYGTYEPFYPYFYHQIYSPKRIDHRVLSLFGTQNSYNGGLHGNLSCAAANYDLNTGDVLTLGSIMSTEAETEDFVKLVNDKLEAKVEDYYLYDDFENSVHNRLCTDESLYEDFFFSTSGLCFFFAPYEIAPYSTGIIIVELPYSEISDLIYEDYLPNEKSIMEGTMKTGSFMQIDMEQFSNMAEVTLSAGEEIMVAYPVGSVEDVRIHMTGDGMNIPDYTVFAAYEMSDGDAVVISLPENDIERIAIEYYNGQETKQIPLA